MWLLFFKLKYEKNSRYNSFAISRAIDTEIYGSQPGDGFLRPHVSQAECRIRQSHTIRLFYIGCMKNRHFKILN